MGTKRLKLLSICLSIVMLLEMTLFGSLPVLAADAQLNTNLIMNPGGEIGKDENGSINLSDNNWPTVSGNAWYAYGEQKESNPIAPHNGNYSIAVLSGTDSPISKSCYQDVDISSQAAEIDNNSRRFKFSAYLQKTGDVAGSEAKVQIQELDENGNATSDVFEAACSSNNAWEQVNISEIVMPGTRKIRITLMGVNITGKTINNDGKFTFIRNYAAFDDLSLELINDTTVAPTLTQIEDQINGSGEELGPLSFMVADADTDVNNLRVTVASSNQTIIKDSDIKISVIDGKGTITLKSRTNQLGQSDITITVSDGTKATKMRFTVTVNFEGIKPTSVSVPDAKTYIKNEQLDFVVNFSKTVLVDTKRGVPYIPITLDSGTVNAQYVSGSGTNALTFRYTTKQGDSDADGINVDSTIYANGGTIRDGIGNDANLTLNNIPSKTGILIDTYEVIIVGPGNCGANGDNLTWILEDTTLTIRGSGAMADYEDSNPPWHSYKYKIKTLILESGVTSIGIGAFHSCSALAGDLFIPASVKSIGKGAFASCSSLNGSLMIPNSVTSIGIGAFQNCSNFDKAIIPASVTNIEINAFYNWKPGSKIYNLSDVTMTQGLYYTGATLGGVYTLTFNLNGGIGTANKQKVMEGNTFTEPKGITKKTVNDVNLVFDGWYNSNNKWNFATDIANNTTMPTGSLELIAKWKALSPATTDMTIDYVNKTLDTKRTDLEYRELSNGEWKKIEKVKTALTVFGAKPYQVRVVSGAEYEASDSIEIFIHDIPNPPSINDENIQATENSITLIGIEDAEYGIDDGKGNIKWQNSNVLTGLCPNTQYNVYARYKATSSHFASDESLKSVKTTKMTLTGMPTASGIYGQNLSQIIPTGIVHDSKGNIVIGTWNFSDANVANIYPYPKKEGQDEAGYPKYTVTFTPSKDSDNYQQLQVQIVPIMNTFQTDAVATLSGALLENGWYTGTVTIHAPEGYKISGGNSTNVNTWSETITKELEGIIDCHYFLRQNDTGFITNEKEIKVKSDKTHPQIKLSYDTTQIFLDWIMGRESLKIMANAVDDGSGVENVIFTLTTENGEQKKQTIKTECIKNGCPIKYQAEITIPAEWKGKIKVDCKDLAGFAADSVYVGKTDGTTGAIVENNPPVIMVTEPIKTFEALGWKDTATFSAAVTDTGIASSTITGGLKSISYKVDRGSPQTVTIPNASTEIVTKHEFDITLNTVGNHTVEITAEDNVGNTTTETKNYKIYKDSNVTLTQKGVPIYDGEAIAEGMNFTLDKGGSEGMVSYQYKVKDTEDSTYVNGLPTNAGNYTIKASIAQDDTNWYAGKVITCDVIIGKAKPTITIVGGSEKVTKAYGDATFDLIGISNDVKATMTYTSSKEDVAIVDSKGKVTIVGAGDTNINVSLAETDNFEAAENKIVTINVAKKAVNSISQNFLVVKDLAKEYSFDLSKMISALTDNEEYKNLEYHIVNATDTKNDEGVLTALPKDADITDGKLNLSVAAVKEKGKTATFFIGITSDNHNISNATITVKIIDKTSLGITGVTMPNRVYNGSAYEYTGTPIFTNSSTNEVATGVTFIKEYEGTGETNYAKSENAPTNVGIYKLIITVSGNSADNYNYIGSIEIPFEITKKEYPGNDDNKKTSLGITGVTMPNRVYNGSAYEYKETPIFTNSSTKEVATGVTFIKEYEGTGETNYAKSENAPTNVGIYKLIITVNGSSSDNYTGSTEIPFEITKKEVVVTATDKITAIGTTIPDITTPVKDTDYMVNGLIAYDTLYGTITMGYSGTPDNSKVGTYSITISGVTVGDNYTIRFENGVLRITTNTTAIDTAIAVANDEKKNISVINKPASSVSNGTKFVTTAEMTALNTAIATAEATKSKVTSLVEIQAVVNTLKDAVTKFRAIIKTGTYTPSSGSSSGGGGGSSSSNANSGGSSSIVPPASGNINSPTTVVMDTPVKVDNNGNATVSVTDKTVSDAIKKAQEVAKRNGTEKNDVYIVINATTNQDATSITANLPKNVQDKLVEANVKEFKIASKTVEISFNGEALKHIRNTAGTDVVVKATKMNSKILSADAQKALGGRMVYDLTATYNGKPISNFGKGSVSIAIPYTLQKVDKNGKLSAKDTMEKPVNLYVVYIDNNGKVTYLNNSSYDANRKMMIFSTKHFSYYGIGYKVTDPVFNDITNHWAKDDIEFVASRGLLAGIGKNTFAPNDSMTRGMIVTALGRMSGDDVSSYKTSSFTDVKAYAYYMPYAEWAVKKGIVSGVGNNTFAPDKAITREEMAVIMVNYAKAKGSSLPITREAVKFTDVGSISSWVKEAVKEMQQSGIISGKDDNKFDPKGTATRAEVSAVLRRYMELVIDTETAQGFDKTDSGKWLYYENGKPITGTRKIDGTIYHFGIDGILIKIDTAIVS